MRRRAGRRPWRLARRAAALLLVLWSAGFLWFWAAVRGSAEEPGAGDGIVVLTGGAGRLAAGGRLLQDHAARRLLVTGVNPSVGPETLRDLLGVPQRLFACCVDLGLTAADTKGNARETADWAELHDLKSLVVVTSDYHMPRSLMLLRRALPGVTLHAHPVRSQAKPLGMALEYSKYLVARLQGIVA
ncbi:MAG: YdcF family protein [Rhodothalassiaceae bacterium]